MIQAMIAKKMIDIVLKKIMQKNEIRKMRKYVEEDNELDIKAKDFEKRIKMLEQDSHPSQEFICCRRCGCEIDKTKSKKRRK